MTDLTASLIDRSQNKCELCGSEETLDVFALTSNADDEHTLYACATCRGQLDGADLNERHLFCLKDSMWSQEPAVQVASYRLLKRLSGHTWASDLLDQLYLPDDVQAWAEPEGTADEHVVTLDCNGTPLADGDSVTLIKDLDVKGAGFTAKRGTLVKNIKLIGDPENIEGRINKTLLVLKTKFMKKVS